MSDPPGDVYLPPFPMNFKHLLLLIATILLALSCSKTQEVQLKPLVVVSIPPQKYFVQKIAGDLVEVEVMIPAGSSPHAYEPKPVQMAKLDRARIYFSIGVEFEKAWLGRLTKTARHILIVPTDSGIKKPELADGHDEQKGHTHGGPDPHIWLSPELVKRQAATMEKTLSTVFPEHAAAFRSNDSLFIIEIAALQDSIRAILQSRQQRPFLVFHPSWGCFAAEFNLKQMAIEVKGNEPSPADLRTIIDFARRNGITAIYAQPQFSRRGADIIAREMGARVFIADPLSEVWEANLIACARALAD
jgi:zinc transport system substrate-binding protein